MIEHFNPVEDKALIIVDKFGNICVMECSEDVAEYIRDQSAQDAFDGYEKLQSSSCYEVHFNKWTEPDDGITSTGVYLCFEVTNFRPMNISL